MYSDDIDELKEKRICYQCIGEAYLSAEVERDGKVEQCSYCGETDKAITVENLADRDESAFEDHYTRTADQPNSWQQSLLSDRESNYDWDRDGVPVVEAIEGAAEVCSEVAEDVQAILNDRHDDIEAAKVGEETEFSSETCYEEKGPSTFAWQEEWRAFEQSLKTEARFFSRSAAAHLTAVFGGIDALKTTDGSPLVVEAGPQQTLDHLYRARVFQAQDKLEEALCRPDEHLGSPPAHLASAGRMNARGISVFYGATEAATAIAEVRPPVGSNVVTAKFSITRPLRLLDLTALEKVQDGGSIFDSTLKDRLEQVAFLQTLGQRMTRPVMPDDEVFEYLPTQAVADFLATENELQLDGIIFPSIQVKDGRNVVLFHKEARVDAMDIPEGTQVSARSSVNTDEGPETDYSVIEEVPPAPESSSSKDDDDLPLDAFLGGGQLWQRRDHDFRDVALRIDAKSVEVDQVDWANYKCTTHAVPRHRFEKREPKY
jgi:hypothetical protein